MNDISAGYAELPRTAYFDHTLRRARNSAEQRSHRYVTLEHLLFALLDDPDALNLLEAVGADVAVIRSSIADAVNHRMGASVVPDGRAPSFSYKFDSLMLAASEDAIRLGRREIDGALAVISIAKDTESNAAAFLTRNGFDVRIAFQHLGGVTTAMPPRAPAPSVPPVPSVPLPPLRSAPRPPVPQSRPNEGVVTLPRDGNMDEMLANVRDLLDQEERKARGAASPPALEPHLPAPSIGDAPLPGNLRHKVEPQLGKEAAKEVPQASRPPLGPTGIDLRSERSARVPSAEEAAPPRKKRSAKENQPAELPAVAGRLVENIPRRMRVAVVETVEVRISKEESAALFEGFQGRGQPQTHDVQVSRAMTVRLCAPEGGFFIETMRPETQWVFDRPSFLGEEAFGRWVWTIIPNQRGAHKLLLIVSSRTIDHHGLAGDVALPEQTIEVRVRINYGRTFGSLFRTAFLLAAGGVMTEGAMYGLKLLGKLPR